MNIVFGDILLFAIIGFVIVMSCSLYIRKHREERRRINQLRMQVVPALAPVQTLPEVPPLEDL